MGTNNTDTNKVSLRYTYCFQMKTKLEIYLCLCLFGEAYKKKNVELHHYLQILQMLHITFIDTTINLDREINVFL